MNYSTPKNHRTSSLRDKYRRSSTSNTRSYRNQSNKNHNLVENKESLGRTYSSTGKSTITTPTMYNPTKSMSMRATRTTGGYGAKWGEEQGHSSLTDLDNHRDGSASEVFPGEKYVSRRSSKLAKTMKKKKSSNKRSSEKENRKKQKDTEMVEIATTKAQVAPHHYEDDSENSFNGILGNSPYGDLYNYADSKYIKKKESEEQSSLLSTDPNKYDPDDPLVQGAYHDEFEDELHDIEVRDQLRNFHNFGEYVHQEDQKAMQRPFCRRFWLPVACCAVLAIMLSVGIASLAISAGGRAKADLKTMTVPLAPTGLKASCSQYGIEGGHQLAAAKMCHDACHQADCCWVKDSNYQCSLDSVQYCDPYAEACTIINDYEGDEDHGDHSDHFMDVPAAPNSLKLSCGRVKDAASTQSTPDLQDLYNICLDECNLAECCWKKDTAMVCSDTTESNCSPYVEHCDVLNTVNGGDSDSAPAAPYKDTTPVVEIPSAPKGLSNYCDANGLKELGSGVCHAYCEPAACCWKEGIRSCYSEKTQCGEYIDDCSVLNSLENNGIGGTPEQATTAAGTNIPVPPEHLSRYCSEQGFDELGRGVCEMFCAEAECCWAGGTPSCSFGNEQCGSYATSCGVLYDGSASTSSSNTASQPAATQTAAPQTTPHYVPSQVPPAPAGLPSYCSAQGIQDLGESACRNYCSQAECCWKEGVKSCFAEYSACGDYVTPCSVFNEMASSSTSAPISNVVGTSAPATGSSSTSTSTTVSVPLAPTDLDYTCSPTQLSNAEYGKVFAQECEAVCGKASCCWMTGVSGVESCTSEINCQDYVEPCQGMVKHIDEHGGAATGSTGTSGTATTSTTNAPGSSLPVAPTDLSVTCAYDVLSNEVDGKVFLIECEKACANARCCWEIGIAGVESCSSDSNCAGYMDPCKSLENYLAVKGVSGGGSVSGHTTTDAPADEVLPGRSSFPPPPDNLAQICSKTSIIDLQGFENCRTECSKAECCWTDDITQECASDMGCSAYTTPCAAMLEMTSPGGGSSGGATSTTTSSSTTTTTAPAAGSEEIKSACNNQFAFFIKSRCEQVCSSGACCFDNSLPCGADVECTLYQPCSVLNRRNLRQG